ncbi:DUF3572 domain-containing protein [Roseivivax sp. GX 12232]|uniref:DUF3572 domain-containing protein n=1 Tax=Roseivivax sp. GX 12232 TaxID=2900547 RepID=UPI001E6456A5|nr:DUF3572 domain-containing protein [Roseivivax sp. GX 12232]MCE0507007.1 DUF3572 domain-containing protein [Roseivivax sp. GX 12232]
MSYSRDNAELVGLRAVGWLAGNDDLLPVFLGATGADERQFREHHADPDFQGSVLDFILMDDAWISAFCEETGLDYSAPMEARAALPGGEAVHWT